MITGVVKSDEARIRLKVLGLRGREQEVEAVIDSGYTAVLTFWVLSPKGATANSQGCQPLGAGVNPWDPVSTPGNEHASCHPAPKGRHR